MPGNITSVRSAWFTAHRLSAQALVLAICLWVVYGWVVATPTLRDRNHLIKGTDFLHFYTLGSIALSHRGNALYDMSAQVQILGEQVPEAALTTYLPLYGPQVSLIFAPFALVPYSAALAAWWMLTIGTYAICLWGIWKTCSHLSKYGYTVALAAAAYPAFFHLIAWGQTSALALACFTGAYLLIRRERWFAAGLALGCLAFKPQLGLAAGCIFLLARSWKVISGALLAGAAQILIGWIYYGSQTMHEYVHHTIQIPQVMGLLEPRIYQTHSLRTFWQMLIKWPDLAFGLYVLSAIAMIGMTFRCWRSSLPLELRYSALLLATALVSPHLTVYDLVILAPALLLTANWLMENPGDPSHRPMSTLCYFVYVLPLIGPLAQWTHVQLSVVAMAGSLWMLWKVSARSRLETSPA